MKKKRFFSVEQIVSVLKEADLGTPVAELIMTRRSMKIWQRPFRLR